MIQQREDFRVFLTIVGFTNDPCLSLTSACEAPLAENVHVRHFEENDLIHVPILSVSYVISRRA